MIGADVPGNPFLRNALKMAPEAGFFDLASHSFNAGTQLLGAVEGKVGLALGLDEVEALLKANGWRGESIRLIACGAGDPALGANAFGAKLSDYLGVVVKAPASDITVFDDGAFVIRPGAAESALERSIENAWTTYGQR
jgi:hypothetical protein